MSPPARLDSAGHAVIMPRRTPRTERPRGRERESARKPLHVAFALGGTDLGRSGIGTYVREVLPPLIAALREQGGLLTAFGHPAELAAYADALEGARQQIVPVTATQPGLNALWYLTRAGGFARRLGADVLLLPAANQRLTARSPLPTVAVVHDLAQLRVPDKYDRLRMFYFRRVMLRALGTATRLVAVSRATREDLVGALEVPAEDVRVVYNGVNTRVFRHGVDPGVVRELRQTYGVAEKPYLFYPARLEHPGKNHVRLLRAFAQSNLARSHHLVLSGGDWGAADLIASTVRELRLDTSVRLLGFVPGDHLPPLMLGAEGVLMLGLHEGFGLPALEGLSAGKPVCVSNTGALPEVVGELGVQCDPLDEADIATALVRLVSDDTLRERCRTDGPAWAEQFTWARTSAGLLSACAEAVTA